MVLMSSITSPAVRFPALLGVASRLLLVPPSLVFSSAAASLAYASVGLVFNLMVPERSLAKGMCTSLWQASCSIGVGSGWTVAVGRGSVPPLDSFVLKTLWFASGLVWWTCTVVCITVGEVGTAHTGEVGSIW